jgi:hypothetical protein
MSGALPPFSRTPTFFVYGTSLKQQWLRFKMMQCLGLPNYGAMWRENTAEKTFVMGDCTLHISDLVANVPCLEK